ncbi:MAG: cytochrome D ubiquinol oxidase subunit I, partial [Acetobacter malorum]
MAGLDPENWDALRALGHRMLDEMLDNVQNVASGPVWQPMPDTVRQGFRDAELPTQETSLTALYRQFSQSVTPYATGNRHPRFMGWVH